MITFIVGPQGSGKNKKAKEMIDEETFEEVSGFKGYEKHLYEKSKKGKRPKNLIIDEFDLKHFEKLISLYNSCDVTRFQELYVLVQMELQEPIIFMRT